MKKLLTLFLLLIGLSGMGQNYGLYKYEPKADTLINDNEDTFYIANKPVYDPPYLWFFSEYKDAIIKIFLESYQQYEKICYNDSTQKKFVEGKTWDGKTFEIEYETRPGIFIANQQGKPYLKWGHKEPTFEGDVLWVENK